MSSSDEEGVCPFRLAFRTEGNMVNCYLAPPDKMEGALLISCLPLAILQGDTQIMDLWRDLMKSVLTKIAVTVIGSAPSHFTEVEAPEIERSGNS